MSNTLVEPKKIRALPPDITVVVGKGDAREEFECYKVALSFASPYFDAMLAANMTENNANRIEFPTKDPNEWKMFYPFIDPSQIGEMTRRELLVHHGNAMILVPWFQEFQMSSCLAECDRCLSEKVRLRAMRKLLAGHRYTNEPIQPPKSFWVVDRDTWGGKLREEAFKGIMKLLQFSCIYELKETKENAEKVLGKLLDSEMLHGTFDLFDISAVKELTELFLPIAEEEDGEGENKCKYFVSQGKSQVLWDMLAEWEFEQDQLKGLSLEEINNNPLLPTLIKTFLESIATAVSLDKTSESAKEVIQDLVDNSPSHMYRQMGPCGVGIGTRSQQCLVGIIKETAKTHKETFEKLRVTFPNFYSA